MPVVSAEAPMLAMLLPSSIAPISRSRIAEQAGDDTGVAVALLRQPQHAGARGAGQRGLARREKKAETSRAGHDDGES